MSENVENLTLEQLRAIRAEMTKMADYMMTLSAEMKAMRQENGALRIERRLELVD